MTAPALSRPAPGGPATDRPAPAAAAPRWRRGPLIRLLLLARPMRSQLLLAVVAGALAVGCAVALLAVAGFMLARASFHPNIVEISVAVTATRAFGIGKGFFRYIERLASHDAAFRVLADVRVAIYRKLERLAPAGLAAFRSGDLLATLVSDVNATQDLFIRGIAPPATAILVGAGATAAGLLLLVPAGLVLGAGLLLAGLAAPWLTAVIARRSAVATAPARGDLAARFSAMISGAADVHVLGAQEEVLAGIGRADETLTAMASRSATAEALGAGLGGLAAGLTLWGVLLLGVGAVGPGALTRVPLAVVTLTALAAFEAVTGLPAAASQIAQARVSAARIAAVLDSPDPVRDPADPVPAPTGSVHLRLTGLSARYPARDVTTDIAAPAAPATPPAAPAAPAAPSTPPAAPAAPAAPATPPGAPATPPGAPATPAPATGETPLVLEGFDLDLPPGRRVALVGPVGAGKSTVASILLRFLDPAAGTVTLNGVSLDAMSGTEVRKLIGGCPQDPYLFDTTIAENLKLAKPDATDAELADAARRVRLLDWIDSLPEGFQTPVGAHGLAVSGGEKQRIALARALLADPAVLILDEPTAHLDPEHRAAFAADLFAATAGRSMLLITHDLNHIAALDEIIVLEEGKVAQRGTHDELMSAGGWYREMLAGRPV